ncbi:MAG: hypothetical protein QM718_04330 [Steroidobacteraceae bacterium]
MQIDALALRLRLCAPHEAADLGVRLCQQARASVYRCYLAALLPVSVLAIASAWVAPWLPCLLLWWAKPWLDRSILFALSRAAFGLQTGWQELWQARRQVWFGQFLRTWTLRRLSASRAYTQPVIQLEQLRGAALRRRVQQLRRGRLGQARLLSTTFGLSESAIALGLVALLAWFAPRNQTLPELIQDWKAWSTLMRTLLLAFLPYLGAVLLVEPCYVAAGFGMYLNRRVELEAWDIEQELRHAFAPA